MSDTRGHFRRALHPGTPIDLETAGTIAPLERILELGDPERLTFTRLVSGRLLVLDEEDESAWTWCSHRTGWNEADWDVASVLGGANPPAGVVE